MLVCAKAESEQSWLAEAWLREPLAIVYKTFFGVRENLINANSDPRYLFLT
jgi:hypothetical protein